MTGSLPGSGHSRPGLQGLSAHTLGARAPGHRTCGQNCAAAAAVLEELSQDSGCWGNRRAGDAVAAAEEQGSHVWVSEPQNMCCFQAVSPGTVPHTDVVTNTPSADAWGPCTPCSVHGGGTVPMGSPCACLPWGCAGRHVASMPAAQARLHEPSFLLGLVFAVQFPIS